MSVFIGYCIILEIIFRIMCLARRGHSCEFTRCNETANLYIPDDLIVFYRVSVLSEYSEISFKVVMLRKKYFNKGYLV